jgi:alkanesulfonate monooxygenase SsuD/methylene tetrahydromethanopterin reductase-like flavin-dependent oxidoreductase (luciferase family)
VQQPFPLWIGGGEKSVARAARYASAFYPLFPTADETREMIAATGAQAREHGRSVELAAVNYGMVTEDRQWLEEYAMPRLIARTNGMTLQEAIDARDDPSLNRPEERLMIGTPQACADRLTELLDAGTDHLVIDFYMHGWENADFGLEHMTKFANEVVPLVGARSAAR